MINFDSVYIFPDTIPTAELSLPLLQFFSQLVYIRAVENDFPDLTAMAPILDELTRSGEISYQCPAPLGPHRDRFLRLIHDIQTRGDAYASQLSHLSLAGLVTGGPTETKSAIINTLLKNGNIESQEEDKQDIVLWQARLLLKLGELYDLEQWELEQKMAGITARESNLLQELAREKQQPFTLTEQIFQPRTLDDRHIRLRLKAWSRLFSQTKEEKASVFITSSQDSFDFLLEDYELQHKRQPVKILSLPLVVPGSITDYADVAASFAEEAAALKQQIKKELKDLISDNGESGQKKPDVEAWLQVLNKHFARPDNSYRTLTLAYLAEVSPQNIFLETFGKDEDERSDNNSPGKGQGMVVGVLGPE